MEVKGRITWVGQVQNGVSQRGNNYSKQDFEVCYEEGQYPKSIVFSTIDQNIVGRLSIGLTVEVKFDIESREYNGRKFNDIRIWQDGLHCISTGQPAAPFAPNHQPSQSAPQQGGAPF